jgi:tyrosine-protein kinase Etk/Wzc
MNSQSTVTAPVEPELTANAAMVEFSLIDVARRIYRGKYLLLALAVVGALLGIGVSKLEKPWYFSQAVFLPPHTDFSASPAFFFASGSDASDLYLGLLVSRTVQDDVVDHLNLKSVFHVPNQAVARAVLQGSSLFNIGRNSLVFVNVRSTDPVLAAKIANAYLDALYRLNGEMVASSSHARSVFYEQQLNDARTRLTDAEQALKNTEEQTGLVLPSGEAEANLNATAQLQAQIGGAEERLAGLLVSETDQNPQVVQARAQLAQLRGELARMQVDSGKTTGLPPNHALPALTLEVDEKERDVKSAESAYDTMLGQYDKARLTSIDPGPQLQIVDRATPSEFKSGPNTRKNMLIGLLLGLIAGLLYLVAVEPLRRMAVAIRQEPGSPLR